MVDVRFGLSFEGELADEHMLDFYDAAEALSGFQRSLALTAHLVLNGEIITQAPALRGARILLKTPEPGSWKVVAVLAMIGSGLHTLGTASRDTIFGHLAISAYDYVVKETLGFHVDFEKTLGQQYEDLKRTRRPIAPPLKQSQLDSLIEKTESSIREMHRPIYAGSAQTATLSAKYKRDLRNLPELDRGTFDYVNITSQVERPVIIAGKVSSYNVNTFRGRIFDMLERRPIPFELAEGARDTTTLAKVTHSLSMNALDPMDQRGILTCTAFRFESSNARLKRYLIVDVV